MAIGYQILLAARGLKVVKPDLCTEYYPDPNVILNPPATGGLQIITIRSQNGIINIPINRIELIGQDPPAELNGELYPPGIMDQILDLLSLNDTSSGLATEAKQNAQLVELVKLTERSNVPTTSHFGGTITTGGTVQSALASAVSRLYLFIQNISDTDMFIRFDGDDPSDTDGILLVAGGGFWQSTPAYCPNGEVKILCATTGKHYVVVTD